MSPMFPLAQRTRRARSFDGAPFSFRNAGNTRARARLRLTSTNTNTRTNTCTIVCIASDVCVVRSTHEREQSIVRAQELGLFARLLCKIRLDGRHLLQSPIE